MTYENIKVMIESLGLPFTYYQWREGDNIPNLPYVVFYFPNSNNFSADNVVWKNIEQMNLEIYTSQKDFAIEKHVEAMLENNGLFWEKNESYIENEDMYEVLYQIKILIS